MFKYYVQHLKSGYKCAVYTDYNNMITSPYLKPNGTIMVHPGDVSPEMQQKKQVIVMRQIGEIKVKRGGSGVYSSGTTTPLSKEEQKSLQGSTIGYKNGVPVILGAPISAIDAAKYKKVTYTFNLNRAQLSSKEGGVQPQIEPATIAAIICVVKLIIVAVTVGAVFYFIKSIMVAGAQSIVEQKKLDSENLKAASEACKVDTEYTANDGTIIQKWNNGTVIVYHPDGTYEIDTTGTVDIQRLLEQYGGKKYETGMEWMSNIILYAVVGVIVVAGTWLIYKEYKKPSGKSEKSGG